jgi:hypothetical protein
MTLMVHQALLHLVGLELAAEVVSSLMGRKLREANKYLMEMVSEIADDSLVLAMLDSNLSPPCISIEDQDVPHHKER